MLVKIILSATSLVIAIFLFRDYNSGSGGPLSSLWKRIEFAFSVIFLLVSIVFLTKAYYHESNKQKRLVAQELIKEFNEFEIMIVVNKELPRQNIIEKQIKIKALIQKLEDRNPNEYDTYFNILINILSAFLGWIIVFTFRNRILG